MVFDKRSRVAAEGDGFVLLAIWLLSKPSPPPPRKMAKD